MSGRVELAHGVLVRAGGRRLVGGAPQRIITLTEPGARLVQRWRGGAPIGSGAAERALAARLLAAGILLADPAPRRRLDDVTIVVPVRDAAAQLARCLAALERTAPGVEIVVVDDGSRTPVAGATIRHERPRGPAAARNAGLAAVKTSLVAFVDADVVVDPGCLERLAAHCDDPDVSIAAPRVRALCDRGLIGRFEARRSSLDMGPHGGLVGPGRRIGHVPATTLVARCAAIPPGGFDETLQVGEDVDLVWRVAGRVLYDPRATVRHDHRLAARAFARRRIDYARSIGALARRHPDNLPALRADRLGLATIALLAARRPGIAAALIAYRAWQLDRGIGDRVLATELALRATVGTALGVSHAIRRVYAPLTLPLAPRLTAAAFAVHCARPRTAPLAIVDDLLALAGTWAGCLQARTVAPLKIVGLLARRRPAARTRPG